jgi:hypothetical protein
MGRWLPQFLLNFLLIYWSVRVLRAVRQDATNRMRGAPADRARIRQGLWVATAIQLLMTGAVLGLLFWGGFYG